MHTAAPRLAGDLKRHGYMREDGAMRAAACVLVSPGRLENDYYRLAQFEPRDS